MEFEEYLKNRSEQIEKTLSRLIEEQDVPYNVLYKAARYSLLGSGKRLRPILALTTAEILGLDPEVALKPVCALELMHTYSLIHDDLPCMDNDDYRRGKPTLHKAFAENIAVLTGDFLLTFAFDLLAHDDNLAADQKIKLIQILAKSTGDRGMIGGQVMDLEAEKKQINLEELKEIHRHKTGALISASVQFGAVLGNASEKQFAVLKEYGKNIGLAFQIIDDVLDVTSSKEKHGKAVASDIINGKSTYVTLLGLEASKQAAQELMRTAEKRLKEISLDNTFLNQLASFVVNRSN